MLKKLTACMIHANDPAKHDCYFSFVSYDWIVENENDGIVSQFDSLEAALMYMSIVAKTSFQTWDVTESKY